jgi:hypothetical protein
MEVVSDKCLNISSLSAIFASGSGGTRELKSDCDNSPKPIPAVGCATGAEASYGFTKLIIAAILLFCCTCLEARRYVDHFTIMIRTPEKIVVDKGHRQRHRRLGPQDVSPRHDVAGGLLHPLDSSCTLFDSLHVQENTNHYPTCK